MTKKRKLSTSIGSRFKIEVKEENVHGDEYLVAKGRLKGVLRQLTERTDSDSDSSDDSRTYKSKRYDRKRKVENAQSPVHHTYVMKLFDRSVDLARFQEDTPLYPICRAWMANQPRNPQIIIKRRNSTPDPENNWNINNNITDVTRLPPPSRPFMSRVPSPTQEQMQDKQAINLNYDECPPVAKDVLIRNHLQRWVNIKKRWISTAVHNEERYALSKQILQRIYNKAQELE